jgi:hypothetical protein
MPVTLKIRRQTTTHAPTDVEYATDLSEGGLFIRTAEKAKPGTTLNVSFAPGANASQEVQARGRVVRVTKDGMAIEFIELDSDSRLLLSYTLAG